MMSEEKVSFGIENFERGAAACFVKNNGEIACDIKAPFSIDPEFVKRRFATHSFIEFINVSTRACLVEKPGAQPCVFVLTDAQICRAALREIGRRICLEVKRPVFIYAGAKVDMQLLEKVDDPRFESFAATLKTAACQLFNGDAQ